MKSISPKPIFEKEPIDGFYHRLKEEVRLNVLTNTHLQKQNEAKAIILFILYVVFYFLLLYLGNHLFFLFFSYLMMGITMIVLFVNSIHDAVHQCAFRSKKMNLLYVKILEFFGGNSYIWSKRHHLLHHPYANIQDWDIDIKQSKLVRIFPNSLLARYHRYQHIYMFLLYPFYTLNWLFVRDFKDFFGKKDNILKRVIEIPRKQYFSLFIFKIVHIVYLLMVPYIVLNQSFAMIFLGWLLMHIGGSLVGVVALVSTHTDEKADFPEVPIDGKMSTSWAMHQIKVTKDFSANSRIATFLYGGFTHHVAHHLFPHIAHSYYPYITPIIQRYAMQYHIPYQSYSAKKAILSHFKLLKKNGISENIFRNGEL